MRAWKLGWRWVWVVLLLLGMALGARADEPTTQPLPRLETGMHTALVWRIATDAAGRWAVTASEDKTARIWDVASGKLLMVLRPPQDAGNAGKLFAVAMSPDGAWVALGGWTGSDWDRQAAIYLFDRISGRMLRRLAGLPGVVKHLAFSLDGRWLAASLGGGHGVRVFDAARGTETGRDEGYEGDSYSVHFSPDGRRLVSTANDGQLRLYAVEQGWLGPSRSVRSGDGTLPYSARFSPDGRRIAVGFLGSTSVRVLDADTLAEVAPQPSTRGIDNSDLASVAWSSDGRFLAAAGNWNVGGKSLVRRWPVNDWAGFADAPLANRSVFDLVPLPGGAFLFATGDPAWGRIGADGQVRQRRDPAIADLRGPERLRLSADGRRVRFGYLWPGQDARSFDVSDRNLGPDDRALLAPRTSMPGLKIENWEDELAPTLDGQRIALNEYERSRSLAIAPDGRRFVLATEWRLRQFDRAGKALWSKHVPSVAWAVNISADARFVVAAYGDGTLRWHRFDNGEEVLALFPHADRRRWVAWTPEGFYATSGPDAEELLGYHLNRGRDREGEFVSARQLREHFYQPELISRRLDADGDAVLARAVARLGDVRRLLADGEAPAPGVELLSPSSVTTDGEVEVRARAGDSGGGPGRLIYRVNGTELEGRPAGIAAGGTESRVFSLPPGRGEITVSALSPKGVESKPVRIAVEVTRAAAAPRLHVLAVGVTDYRDGELRKGVRFAAQDARQIARLFQQQGTRLYGDVRVQVLADAQASGAGIRAALAAMAREVQAQDVFVLYLAGHGASFERSYHFIPWDAVYTSAAALRERSLNNEDFRGLLAQVLAAKSVVLLDTCSAGGFGAPQGRSLGQKEAIDRLSRLTGRAMIAATADDRMALEGEGGHGAFTYTLLEGLRGEADRDRNGSVEVRELADYVEQQLPSLTRRRWGVEQFPFSATEGHSFTLVPRR